MMKSRQKIILLSVVLGLLTVSGSAYGVAQFNQPARGVVTTGPSRQDPSAFLVPLAPKLQTSRYASFDYPAGMTPRRPEPVRQPFVAGFAYTARNIESWVLAVDIQSNPVGTLSGNSSYQLRKDSPARYQESHTVIGGQPVVVMTDVTAGGFSKVAYLTHGGLLATVSLIGSDADGVRPLQSSFDMVLNSWHWSP